MRQVITSAEMARIEKLAYESGASDLEFMENAAAAMADHIEHFVEERGLPKQLLAVIGKGNKGGDGAAVCKILLHKGYDCLAWQLAKDEECSPLCQKQLEFYKKGGGKAILFSESNKQIPPHRFIIDALTGTGFHGKTDGELAAMIECVNESGNPVISIDLPSGLDGNTGIVGNNAIYATQTIYLGALKLGFFLNDGWNHVGELIYADFGLQPSFFEHAKIRGTVIDEEDVRPLLPRIQRNRHKYQAGYVLGIAGSKGMSGAALLAAKAALSSGCGIVRLFYPYSIENEMVKAPYELITERWDLKETSRIFEESKRAKALFIGPGIGRAKETKNMVKHILSKAALPIVIDADALYFLAENPRWSLPENAILTPQKQEMLRLLDEKNLDDEKLIAMTQKYADAKNVTIVLKGAPTWIFHPHIGPVLVTRGDPGMATAGSGDVLTGVIASLLAQGLPPYDAAVFGVYLHSLSGESAAFEKTSYCVNAPDLIEHFPDAFFSLI